MAYDGECIKQLFYMVGSEPVAEEKTLSLPTATTSDCCSDFLLYVLADIADDNNFKNDKRSFIYWFPDIVTAAVFTLQKSGHVGVYEDVATLNNNDYGTLYEYGFYTNAQGENYIGYLLEWRTVLDAHGAGIYRMKLTTTSAVAGEQTVYSLDYNLMPYSEERANGTVKLEYYLNGIIGDNEDDTKRRDFGELNWYNALRFRGVFGFDASKYETEFIKYANGQQQWIEDNQVPEYILKTKMLPAVVHNIMRTDVLQADVILVTDYNKNNPNKHIDRGIKRNGDYAPAWKTGSRLAAVEVSFVQEYQNHRRHRC